MVAEKERRKGADLEREIETLKRGDEND